MKTINKHYMRNKSLLRFSLQFTLLIFLILSTGCLENSEDFSFLEEPSQSDDTTTPDVVAPEITSYTPTDNPVKMTNASNTTFVVSINPEAGSNVTYTWKLNGALLSSTSNSYYSLNGSALSPGSNNLVVEASNSVGSASKIFNLAKNQAPTVSTQNPAAGGNTVNCGGGTIQLDVTAADPDGDALTFTWKLNGAVHATYFSILTGATSSVNDFTPPCSVAGASTVAVEISDGYDTTTASWSVTVTNPTVAQINGYNPTAATIVIPSTASENFSISATGKDPLAYEWRLNGTAIPGETNSFINLNAASIPVGTHTLKAVVSDYDSNDDHDFIVKRNAPPVLSNESPTDSTIRMNYQSFKTFTVDGSDGNSDTINYTWTLNDVPSAYLAASSTGSGSQAIFSPDASLIGSHTIKVTASDGTETATQSWTVKVNYFTDACNNLTPGQICTIVGYAGLGSGLNPTTNPQLIKFRPENLLNDGSDNYFISDIVNDVVWFYNRSGGDITVIGTLVTAGTMKIIAGTGAQGNGTAGVSAKSYHLYDPQGMVWDAARGDLYVASYNSERVVRFTSSGIARHDICSGSTGNGWTQHTDGNAADTQGCRRPSGLAFDSVGKQLFVASDEHHHIKVFDISDPDPANWTGSILVGRQNANGSISNGSDNGDIGGGTSSSKARTRRPFAMKWGKDNVLYFTQREQCRLRAVNLSGSTKTYFGGAVSINNNQVKTIAGDGTCNVAAGAYSSLRFRNPRGLALQYDGSNNVIGFFVANDDYDRITYINNTGSAVTIGGKAVSNNQGQYVWGNGQDGYSGESKPASNNLLYTPRGMTLNAAGDKLVIADVENYRVRTLDISVDNGNLASIAEGKEKADFSGGGNTPAPNSVMSNPSFLQYDAANNAMLFSDLSNGRVRSINLITGAESVVIGQGNGNADQDQEDAQDVYIREPRGLALLNNGIIFVNNQSGTGANKSCLVRTYNRNSSATSFFGTLINANKVSTFAGNYASGCNNWNASWEGGAATSALFRRPEGITTDGNNLYVANYDTHCILKIDSAGVISRYAGACNSAGYTDATPASSTTARFRYPIGILSDPNNAADGNLFVVDQTNQATGRIRYINKKGVGVTIAGVTIGADSVGTLFNTGGYSKGIAAFENQICYTSGELNRGDLGSHNVICKNMSDPLGNTTLRVGPADGSTKKGGSQEENEEEGIAASSATLNSPYGLAFDGEGNLFITERSGHVIRMVKRWW